MQMEEERHRNQKSWAGYREVLRPTQEDGCHQAHEMGGRCIEVVIYA